MIAYYYGQTGFACVIYYRRSIFKSVKNFFLVGLLPLIGGLSLAFIFVWSLKDMTHADFTDPPSTWLGVSPVFWIGLGTLLAGIPLMYLWNTHDHAFFRVKPDPIDQPSTARGWGAAAAARREGRAPLMAGEVIVGYDGQAGRRRRAAHGHRHRRRVRRPARDRVRVPPGTDRWRGRRPGAGPCATSAQGWANRRWRRSVRPTPRWQRPSSSSTTDRRRPCCAVGDEHDALVIVVGTTGRGPITGSLLGSVTYQVVHRSTRPVLVVPVPPGN